MSISNKTMMTQTRELTLKIIDEVESYVAKRRARGHYSLNQLYKDMNITHTSWAYIKRNENRSITLDTAVRLLDNCGLRLKIVPKIMPRNLYDHKGIIPPSEYATSGKYIVDTLVKKLPIVIGSIDLTRVDNKTYNAVRIIRKTLKRLKSIKERDENNKRKESAAD